MRTVPFALHGEAAGQVLRDGSLNTLLALVGEGNLNCVEPKPVEEKEEVAEEEVTVPTQEYEAEAEERSEAGGKEKDEDGGNEKKSKPGFWAKMKERLENCREEADRRKGDDPDRDVARLDRGVKERPLQHEERAHAHDAEAVELFDGVELLRRSGPEPDESARDDDAPEDDEAGRQGDELAEDARPPRKKNREVELNEGFGYGIHGRVRLVLLKCRGGLRPWAGRCAARGAKRQGILTNAARARDLFERPFACRPATGFFEPQTFGRKLDGKTSGFRMIKD